MSLDKVPLDLLAGSNPRWWPTYWGLVLGNTGSATGVAGRVYLTPFWISRAMTASALSFNVATAGGGGTSLRIGLYGDAGRTPLGGALLEDSGDMDATVTGSRLFTFPSPRRLARGWSWGFLETADVTVQYLRSAVSQLYAEMGSERMNGCYYDRAGGYGAPTNPCPALTSSMQARVAMFLRVDSIDD